MKTIEELLRIDREPKDKKITSKELVIILENKQRINLKHYKYSV